MADLNFNNRDPLRAVIALDRQVSRARAALQRTSELDPAFERRVAALVELVSRRDQVLGGAACSSKHRSEPRL